MDKQYNQGNPNQSEHGAAQTAPAPDHDVNEVDDMATAKSIKAPAFQFYPGDFLSSDNVDRMSMTERGVYITLMAKYWLAGDLPADMADLASMVRMKTAQFERMWKQGRLHLCFEERNGRLTQRRLEAERKKQAEYKRRQSDNGLKGGRPKKAVVTSGLTQPEATAKPTESSSSLSLSSSSFSSSEKTKSTDTARPSTLVQPYRHSTNFAHMSGCGHVQHFLHAEFLGKVGNASTDNDDAERIVRAFYAAVEAQFAGQVIGDEPVKFWRARFAEKWPSVPMQASTARRPAWAPAPKPKAVNS